MGPVGPAGLAGLVGLTRNLPVLGSRAAAGEKDTVLTRGFQCYCTETSPAALQEMGRAALRKGSSGSLQAQPVVWKTLLDEI